jgi:hypothetical protein
VLFVVELAPVTIALLVFVARFIVIAINLFNVQR